MPELIELTAESHSGLRIVPAQVWEGIKLKHISSLRVNEVGQAASCLPIFLNRDTSSGNWTLSAVSGLHPGKNLCAGDNKWEEIFQPSSLQTYPFYLMQSPSDENTSTIGIDTNSGAFSEDEGELLFEIDHRPSNYLNSIRTALEANLKNDVLTLDFTNRLNQLCLIKPINVVIEYANGELNTLTGLHTIDEDKLQSLALEEFDLLRSKGYMAPIYAMLISIFQLNSLLQKNNAKGEQQIARIKLEVPKAG